MDRPYIMHELTRSTCPTCLRIVDAKVRLHKDGTVTMEKRCPEHGSFEALLATDIEYYCQTRQYNKPGSIPCEFSTEVSEGCPADCGLCPDHEQHTCLGLIEITQRCNMNCPICFADSGMGQDLNIDQIKAMLDRYKQTEGKPEVLQISGGEPTLHPQLLEILHLAREFGFKAFLINTNGIRIAQDEEFVASLQEFGPELEIYLQYDSFSETVGKIIRGQEMSAIRQQAVQNLEKYNICTNLVTTLVKNVNEHEILYAIESAVNHPNVTGVALQLVTGVGRAGKIHSDSLDRLTVPDVLKLVETQTSGMFKGDDFIPLPCPHPHCCSLTYAFVTGTTKKSIRPITRYIDIHKYLDYFKNTIAIDVRDLLNDQLLKSVDRLWSASATLKLADVIKDLSRCCGAKFKPQAGDDPLKLLPGKPLRILIKPFMDAYNYNLKRAKKCCIHVITPELKMIPFCNYNIFYRHK